MPVTASKPFKWRHYPGDIILWCVRWYLRFPISFAHLAEMALERRSTRGRREEARRAHRDGRLAAAVRARLAANLAKARAAKVAKATKMAKAA